MKNKLVTLLLCLAIVLPCVCTAHAESANRLYTAAEIEGLCDGIVAYKEAESGAGSVQGLIDGGLCDSAGISAEFYVIALSQRGDYNFSGYENALLAYLRTHEVYAATSCEKYALALIASGSTDSYITKTADEAIGGQGLMSLIFGLHILNNDYDSAVYSVDGLISEILSYRLSDGGWAVMGSQSDVDVTAMALQALAPYYGSRGDVRGAVDEALGLLSQLQQGSGGFKSMGTENCESAAQVLTALSALGIDAQYDGRFLKNGCSVLDGLLSYRNADGSFTHTGGGFNETATMQAFYAMVAYLRFCYGQEPLYLLDHARPYAMRSDTGSSTGGSSGGSGGVADPDVPDAGSGSVTLGGDAGAGVTEAADETVAATAGVTQAAAETEATQTDSTDEPPRATVDERRSTADESDTHGGGYKLYAVIGVLLAAGVAVLVLFLLKKRSKKNLIVVAIAGAAGILFILLTNFQSAEAYRQGGGAEGDGVVTMSICCDTVIDREKVNDYIPDDGVILGETTFSVSEGDTAFDVLMDAAKTCDIAVDYRGSQGAAYIAGINYLYELDYGDLSGWMYRVNGVFPDVGCQSCYLYDGDRIEWLYTTEIGKDL